MQDKQLQKLTTAYIDNEMDFEDYRLKRTLYIDTLTGYDSDDERDNTPTPLDDGPVDELSPLVRLLLSTALIITLFFIFRLFM